MVVADGPEDIFNGSGARTESFGCCITILVEPMASFLDLGRFAGRRRGDELQARSRWGDGAEQRWRAPCSEQK